MPRFLCFTVADLALAIHLDQVAEVAPLPQITRIPRPGRHIEGLVSLRGRPIPVVDLRKRLGLVNPATGGTARMIVALPGGRDEPLGLIVDAVGEILSVGEAERPRRVPAPWVDQGFLLGALEVQGRQVLLPDLEKLADLA
jgi:purine-binding chemotaxis protein CheW